MKGKKCFGLLFLLATIFGLSLNVYSDTNALKYEVTTIPFGFPAVDKSVDTHLNDIYSSSNLLYDNFGFSIPVSNDWTFVPHNETYYYNMTGNETNCYYTNYDSVIQDNSNSSYIIKKYRLPYYDTRFKYENSSVAGGNATDMSYMVRCNQLGSIDNIDSVSFPPYAFGTPDLRSYIPYRYGYNGIFAHGVENHNGLIMSTRFSLGDLFGYENSNDNSIPYGNLPESFKSIDIPLGIMENQSDLHSGSSVVIRGSFMFDSDDPQNDVFQLDSNFKIQSRYAYAPQNSYLNLLENPVITDCTYNLIDNRSNSDEYPWELKFSCPMTVSYMSISGWDYTPVTGFSLRFSTTGSLLWTYPSTTMVLTSFDVVTNNDETPYDGTFNGYDIDGNDIRKAPGYAGSENDPNADVSWYESLLNLFNFDFINPFAPMLNLFNNQDSCASIPTIAGMLHSEETTVCPWFNATTRNIATPVLGISSIMLVFGFAVHWLGARSGNMFEDSVETDNYRFRSRVGKK